MTRYSFIEDDWAETKSLELDAAKNSENLPIATEYETAFLFRDASGNVVHRYSFPDRDYDNSFLRYYLDYIARENLSQLTIGQFKYELMKLVEICLLKVAPYKKRVRILEIGSTIGENYSIIKHLLAATGLDVEVEYIGLEKSSSLVQFSRLVHGGDPHFTAIQSDGGDLERFPDAFFDFVINQGVANFVADPLRTFSELVRVTELAVICGVQLTLADEPFFLTRDIGYSTYLPTRNVLKNAFTKYGPVYDYHTVTWQWENTQTSGSGSDRFIGVSPDEIQSVFEYHLITPHRMFPEMEDICTLIHP